MDGPLVQMDEYGTGRSYDIPASRFTKAAEKLSQNNVVSGIRDALLSRPGLTKQSFYEHHEGMFRNEASQNSAGNLQVPLPAMRQLADICISCGVKTML